MLKKYSPKPLSLFLACLFLITAMHAPAYAKTFVNTQTKSQGKIRLAAYMQMAPYIVNTNPRDIRQASGFDIDLLHETFSRIGLEIDIELVPFDRMRTAFDKKYVDAAMIGDPHPEKIINASRPYRYWRNVAITEQSMPEFALPVAVFPEPFKYLESYSLSAQRAIEQATIVDGALTASRMLHTGRINTFIGDWGTFHHYILTKPKHIPTVDHRVIEEFPPNAQAVLFHDLSIRDDFNKALKSIIADGTYQKLAHKHNLDFLLLD